MASRRLYNKPIIYLLILAIVSFYAPIPIVSVPIVSAAVSATGGTITTDGNYKVHTFTSSDTFTVTGTGDVEYLIAGGGGSGSSAHGGGGGWTTNGALGGQTNRR